MKKKACFNMNDSGKKIGALFIICAIILLCGSGSGLAVNSAEYAFILNNDSYPPTTITFPDVPTGHWAYDSIMLLVNRGVISGYEDGLFKPNELVRRSEFAKMMTLALQIPLLSNPTPSFVDLDRDDWEFIYVETAKKYLTGYQQGDSYYFRGNEPAVREDMAVALVKALGLENQQADVNELKNIFSDHNTISANLQKYVLIAYKNELISGYPDGTFAAQKSITRAETAALLVKVLKSEAMKKVTFDDAVVSTADDYITIKGMRYSISLTELNLAEMGLRNEDIAPLKHMTNLKWLALDSNQITDLLPLAGLTDLTWLSVDRNQISNLTPLSGLINLSFLFLSENHISNLQPLSNLANLTDLYLTNNQISDLMPLASLTNLTTLYLYSNKISNLTSLSNLTNLTILLLHSNQLSDLQPLSKLTNLTDLGLGCNQISDLKPLSGLTKLTRLDLDSNQISNVTPLAGLTNLTELNLGGNQIRNATPLAGLTNLTELNLSGNQIRDWSPVKHVPDVLGRQ